MFDQLNAAFIGVLAFLGLGQAGATYQGYIEGEYVLVAPQIAGSIENMGVTRGQQVHKGDTLYILEHAAEQAVVDQAKAQADRADATLADLLKAKRQPELDQLIASRDEAKAALQIATLNVERDEKQIKSRAISQAALDTDRAQLDQAKARLAEQEAALATGKLSTGRDDAIKAAQADVGAAQAALAAAQWKLDQKKITAPADALVFDTLYRAGEFVPAGQPAISLLPSANIKVRFFVPAPELSSLPLGSHVAIEEKGKAEPAAAHVTYISPQAEYSPPELYNRDNREKLLFMVEATPDSTPEHLRPGLPVDVRISAP